MTVFFDLRFKPVLEGSNRVLLTAVLLLFCLLSQPWAAAQKSSRQEESQDYFKKWLREDVVYIITEEEKSVFQSLRTPEERENFIEQFWRRRDPDPRTAYNEYKEEHYRRIQYANDHFKSGIPGWRTDRGMIYIKFGPPDSRESHPTGTHYLRPSWEGGGSTSTVPFEKWHYRYLEGVGQDIELEFVDDSLTGEYRLTFNPDDKDALLRVPGAGLTDAEFLGLARRVDRIVRKTSPMPNSNPLIGYGRVKDQPFEKLQTMVNLERPPRIGFKDLLRTQVESTVRFDLLPFQVGVEYLPVDATQYLVPLTVALPNAELNYQEDQQGLFRSILEVYGQVTSLGGQIITSFEETIGTAVEAHELDAVRSQRSVYQKTLQLPPGRYKLDVIVHDEQVDKLGTRSIGVVLPKFSEDELALSSIVLADRIEVREGALPTTFGPAKVFPNVTRSFTTDQPLLVFFQLSNFALDQASRTPSLSSRAELWNGDKLIRSAELNIGESAAPNLDKLHLVHAFDLDEMKTGRYRLRLRVEDRVSGKASEREVTFTVSSGRGS